MKEALAGAVLHLQVSNALVEEILLSVSDEVGIVFLVVCREAGERGGGRRRFLTQRSHLRRR